MAINFLNNVDFNSIQSQNIVIENFTSDAAAGTGVEGQLYWNTTVPSLRGYDVSLGAWIPIGTINDILTFAGDAGGNQTVDLNAQTFTVAGTTNQIVTSGAGQTLTIAFPTIVTLPASSIVATTPTAGDDSLKIATTAFVKTAVEASDTLAEILAIGNVTGGTDIAVSAGDDITFTATSAIVDPGSSKGTAGQYLASTGTTIDWLDLPIDPNEKYTLPVTALAGNQARVSLTGSTDGVVSTVDFIGTAGRIAITSQDQNNGSVTIDFPDDVTIVDDLTVGGIITQLGTGITTGVNDGALTASTNLLLTANNTAIKVGMQVTGIDIPVNITVVTVTDAKNFVLSGAITITNGITITFEEVNSFAAPLDMNNNRLHEVKTGVLGTDGVNLGQVQSLVAGIGVFKGGYNATTGLTVPDGLEIEGANNIALDKGDYFVVTTAGSAFFSLALEAGDFIFAETAITANSSPPVGDYIVVRADDNVAGAGATDGATQKGVSGFDSANFTVSSNGWVQIKSLSRLNGRKQVLDDGGSATPATSPVERDFLNGFTTFEIDLADASLFGTGALAEDVTVEVTQHVSPYQTVYADVTRSGSASMSIIFSGNVAVDTYRVLLEYV